MGHGAWQDMFHDLHDLLQNVCHPDQQHSIMQVHTWQILEDLGGQVACL